MGNVGVDNLIITQVSSGFKKICCLLRQTPLIKDTCELTGYGHMTLS